MAVTNLNQLKKALVEGAKIEVVEHFYHPECSGQIREVTKVQTNAVFIKPIARRNGELNEKDMKWVNANEGKGSYMPFGKACQWSFCNGIIQYYDLVDYFDNGVPCVKKVPIATYRLIKEN